MMYWILILVVSIIRQHYCVEVHFEATDSGFFLKHLRQPPIAPNISNVHSSTPPTKFRSAYDSVLSVDRFTVVQTTQPVSIRASYGPFSTKQTVPARYIVPDTMENQSEYLNNTTAALLELQQSNVHLDISAHLVRTSIPQDSPVLRVLFHAGADPGGHLQRQKICVLLHVTMGTKVPLKGRCIPEGEDGVCVAEVIIPSNWWPALIPPHKGNSSSIPLKVPQRLVQVSYSVFEPPLRNAESCEPKVQIQPLTVFARIPLVSATTPYKELRGDELLSFFIPQCNLYPMSKIHVPVFLHQSSEQTITAFTVKARVKSGIKILGATVSSEFWNISFEKENLKHTTGRVTAVLKDDNGNISTKKASTESERNGSYEVFSWLLEIADDTKEALDGGKIVWSVSYIYENPKIKDMSTENVATDESKKRFIVKLEINKDDIQAVLPMAKNWELMNTAVLTGRQVAQTMKVFIVSQAGKIADITLQSSCHAEDESVIKVSSSCSSVYVDGSEIRGSSNASVIVKYGIYSGLAKFIVWMPEFPLEVYISDFRLSQIKGWKVFDDAHYMHNKQPRRKKRSYVWGQHNTGFNNNVNGDKMTCRVRYQQSRINVYARFLAIDQNSGRISYFISRRTSLRVTDLVKPLLRIADPKIASLKGTILQGKSMGRTDVQVLSPVTGRVIGAKEVRVGSDKVSLSKLIVRVVSGLQLTIASDSTIENGYIAETSVTHKLTAQYQEGLLDIDLVFSDGSKTPLRDISVEDYFLHVESLDTEVVAFAPMLASHHPRVIAVGEGNGNLLRVTLLLSEDCRMRRNVISSKQMKFNSGPLASALASVEVDFNNADSSGKQESVQNDGVVGREKKSFHSNGDLADIIVGIPLRDSSHTYDSAIHSKDRGHIHSVEKFLYRKKSIKNEMTSMEVGMYVLLSTFCFAIIVFVVSCVVYASKFRPANFQSGLDSLQRGDKFNTNGLFRDILKEPTTNAHDWVWLGRSNMDRSSTIADTTPKSFHGNGRDSRMRITNNPIITHSSCNNGIRSVRSFRNHSTNVNGLKNAAELSSTNNDYGQSDKTDDYRPPVPPHRDLALRSFITGNSPGTNEDTPVSFRQKYKYQEYDSGELLGTCGGNNRESNGKLQEFDVINNKDKFVALQPASEQIFSPPAKHDDSYKGSLNGLHNAEKLVQNSNQQQKNVFQFDTLSSKNMPTLHPTTSSNINADASAVPKNQASNGNSSNNFVTCESGSLISKQSRVKRATVVGNPMFSTAADVGVEPDESLGLDDLDMDYAQIMHYFDNLKESNA